MTNRLDRITSGLADVIA